MPRNQRNALLFSSILFVWLAACGRSVTPAPITNPGSVETSLASTARWLAQQTETAQGFTATPPVVPTVTMTPTPKISSAGTSLEILSDGSTRFTDHTAGIQAVFPPGWLAVRVGETEYYQAWDKLAAKNPVFQNVFASIQNTDPSQFRVTAIDTRSEVTQQSLAKIDIVFLAKDERSLNELRIAQTNQKRAVAKFKVLSSTLTKTTTGLEVAIVDLQWQSVTPENEFFLSYHRDVIFKVAAGTVDIQLFSALSEKDRLLPELEKVLDSLTLLNP